MVAIGSQTLLIICAMVADKMGYPTTTIPKITHTTTNITNIDSVEILLLLLIIIKSFMFSRLCLTFNP
jgi:hypothetical protein